MEALKQSSARSWGVMGLENVNVVHHQEKGDATTATIPVFEHSRAHKLLASAGAMVILTFIKPKRGLCADAWTHLQLFEGTASANTCSPIRTSETWNLEDGNFGDA